MLFILNKSHKVVGSLNSNGDLSKITTYFDDSYVQDLATGAETFQFSTLADNIESQHLVVGNFIAFKEEDEFKLFNIVQIEETHEDTFIKTVYCEMASIELINEIVRPMKVLNSSLRKFLNSILEETEWQLGKMDAGFTQVYDFEISDYTSVYSLIQEYAVGVYGAEISYRVEIEHGEIVGKYIDCYAERGNSNGFRFAYGSNLTSVVRTVDTSELATALIGIGNNGLTFKSLDLADKPMGQDFIASESAYKQWNVNGSHIMGIHRADTDSEHELLRLTRIALEERSEPKVKYEMKVEILGKKVKIGDTVNVVDHEFNPPLYLSARVNQLTKSKTNPYNDEVVLANFKELNSNITEEMRQLATQLEGYVDSQFPIGADKIQDGAIGEQQISKQYHTQVVADAVYASMIEVGELVATKVDVEELNAIYASIEDLNAKKASIEDLTAQKAEIEELVAKKADIESLKAITANIETLYTEKANVTDLNALNATVTNLKAEKADINDLNATNATIESLKASKADIDSLNALEIKVNTIDATKANITDLDAVNATIGSLQANKADIVELNAVKGDITHLYSEVAEIGTLKSDVADINELLAGNITADNIATGAITAGSGIIADGAIGSAQISDLDASKISAGVVDTSKVTIQGVDGHLKLKGNRLQVFTGTGDQAKERVSLGDVNGDGTIYGLRVRGADGQTVLLDENGVTSEGITDGSINNSKISDDANIDGSKLNINSVVSKINEDGTETIQGTKIEVDGTTLNTKLSTITTKQTEDSERITQAQSQITANTNAIKLKVDEQTYATDKEDMTSKLEKNTSEISAMKGQIALKVEQADIENAISEVEGVIDTKIDSAKAEIKVTTDTISQNVSNLSQTVSTKADGSTVTTLSNKVGSLETSVNGISGKVTNLEKTTTTLGTQVSDVQDVADSALNKANSAQSTANTANSTANANKGNITNLQGEVSTIKSDVASLEVTTSGISQKVSSVESTTASLSTQVTTAQNTANQAKTDASNANSNATNALNTANSANSKIDNLNISDRNLVKNSDMFITTGSNTNKCTMSDDFSQLFNNNKGKKLSISIEVNATNALSTNTSGSKRLGCELTVTYSDDTKGYFGAWQSLTDNALNLNKKRVNNTYTIPNKDIKSVSTCGLYIQGLTSGTVKIGKPKYQISDKSSDWTPAPEDIDNAINTVDGKLTTLQGEYNTTKSQVATLETNLDGITQRVSSTESTTATLTNKVNTAQSTADSAKTTATNAQNTANTANTNASSALSKAESATTEITKTNQKVSSIETNLSGITSRVSSVESKQSTTDGKVSSLETRMSSAEQKITDKAIISTVTETINNKVNEGINGISLGGKNIFINSDFNKTVTTTGTTDKHQNLYPYSWGGYNGGITNPTTSYHAHIDNDTFSYNVVEYNESDGTRNWKGITQQINVDLLSDSEYVISVDATATLNGAKLFGGFYYTKKGSTSTNFHSGQFSITNFSTDGFTRVSSIVPLNYSDIDLTKNVSFYIYGYGFSSNSILYIKNVKLEKGNKSSDWTPSPEDVENSISDTEKVLNGNIDSAVSSAKDDVLKNVGDNYTAKDEFTSFSQTVNSQLEQTSKDITATFTTAQNYTKEVDGKLQSFQETVGTHIRFSSNGIDLGKTNSPFTATLDNTKLAFKQDGTEVAYISNNKMYITQAEIKDSLRIGSNTTGFFTWVQSSNGNLSLKWSDK